MLRLLDEFERDIDAVPSNNFNLLTALVRRDTLPDTSVPGSGCTTLDETARIGGDG